MKSCYNTRMGKTIVYFSYRGLGHFNPTSIFAAELVKRGHNVIYYAADQYRDTLHSLGIHQKSYPQWHFSEGNAHGNLGVLAREVVEITNRSLPILLEEMRNINPDIILYDTIAMWGNVIAHVRQKPSVALFTTFAFNAHVSRHFPSIYLSLLIKALLKKPDGIYAYYRYCKLAKKYSLSPKSLTEFLLSKGTMNIVFTSGYFQPCSESFDNSFHFVGPSLSKRKETIDFWNKLDLKKKTIYISLGSILTDNLNFYKLCINTFANAPYQVILSLGNTFTIKDLPPIPQNIFVKNYIPQLEILQKTDVFITHGGMNSVSEGLYYGVPLVIIPHTDEMKMNAKRVVELRAGVQLSKDHLTSQKLKNAVALLLQEKRYSQHAAMIQSSFRNAGGYKKACKIVDDYLKENRR